MYGQCVMCYKGLGKVGSQASPDWRQSSPSSTCSLDLYPSLSRVPGLVRQQAEEIPLCVLRILRGAP